MRLTQLAHCNYILIIIFILILQKVLLNERRGLPDAFCEDD